MENFKHICADLRDTFSQNAVFKAFLPLDVIFLFGGVGVMFFNHFINVGSFLSTLAYYLFFFGVILTIANYKLDFLYMAFFAYAALGALRLISGIFTYKYLNYDAILILLIFGSLGIIIYNKLAVYKNKSMK